MAVCKQCGCAIPLGKRACDICATTAAIAPAGQPQPWQPPADAGPVAFASSAASWASGQGTTSPAGVRSSELARARKDLKWAWSGAAFIGTINVVAGALAELVPITALLRLVNWGAAVEGAIYILLAYFIRRGSKIALGLATGLLVLDGIALLIAGQAIGAVSPLRIVILLALVRGFHAIDVLRRAHTESSSEPRAA
jgi:hypothetical protein